MAPRTLLFGASGQLGKTIKSQLQGVDLFSSSQSHDPKAKTLTCDFRDPNRVLKLISDIQPNYIINAAAYTAVERAEIDEREAIQLNASTPGVIAQACAKTGSTLIHFSTDYVFDGSLQRPYTETDQTNPLNVYGKSKLQGELAIRESGCKYFILRTSWLFSPFGNNFVKTMLKLGMERDVLQVVDDQIGTPTSTYALAQATQLILNQNNNEKCGLYHVSCRGEASWYEFAEEIFRVARDLNWPLRLRELKRVKAKDYPSNVPRPPNSRLNHEAFTTSFQTEFNTWQHDVAHVLGIVKDSI